MTRNRRTTEGAGRPRKYRKYPPATAARGATPEGIARALFRRPVPDGRTPDTDGPDPLTRPRRPA
ncbi:MAG: hypothetical protein OXK74_11835 [Gemmatimonadota bacterium]|nr:hypothetical protein [Gemmatimonadota bacterium]MDE2763457.1 hypothetical protein [Gemmatimonadota bacterium]